MPKPVWIEMLGQLKLTVGGQSVSRFRTYKTGALLAYLAYKQGRPAPRDELVDMLWPEAGQDQARNSLSQCVSSLRHVLEPPGSAHASILEATRQFVRLNPEACDVDVNQFRDLAKLAGDARRNHDTVRFEKFATEATGLFGGEFLPGLYEEWTLGPREHLREEALGLLDALIDIRKNRGELREALDLALKAVTIDPSREASHVAAIRLYDALGQPDAAVKQYRDLERTLASQLGIKPSEAVREVARTALRRERETADAEIPAAPVAVPVQGTPSWLVVDASDRALDRLRRTWSEAVPGRFQFGDPESAVRAALDMLKLDPTARIEVQTRADPLTLGASQGQILVDEPTASLSLRDWVDLGIYRAGSQTVRLFSHPSNAASPDLPRSATERLPAALNPFFGRQLELSALKRLLTEDAARLVTVTGPGGMGKTRLTLEAARGLAASFPKALALVQLADIETGDGVWTALLTALGGAAATKSTPRDQCVAMLSGGPALLVFDNFEQLVDTGGRDVAESLLALCPETRLLVSSRRRLGVEGEAEVSLSPLDAPTGEDTVEAAMQSPSVALFVDRAVTCKPDFVVTEANVASVTALCRRLEGIPLALELAASRAQVLSPSQILERFDQRLDLLATRSKTQRHRSLRAALDWTYEMLSPELQQAFRRLSVFRGGWGLDEAEAVVGSAVTLDLLAELCDFSLVISTVAPEGPVRFHMLDTMRDYGRDAMSPEELEEALARHKQAYMGLVQSVSKSLEGPMQTETLERLEADAANIRAAVEHALDTTDVGTALAIGAASWRFWHLRSHIHEGRDLLRRALSAKGGDDLTRARAENGAGRLAYLQGDYDEARGHHERALQLAPDDQETQALGANALGAVAYETGDYATAERLFGDSLQMRRAMGDAFGIGNSLSWLGIIYTDQARLEEARAVLLESLEVRESIGDTSGIARSHNSLGIVERRFGNLETASEHYERALALHREMGDKRAIGGILSNLGMIALATGDLDRSGQLFDEALSTNKESGDKWGIGTVLANQASLALARGDLAAAKSLNSQSLKVRSEIGNPWGIAYSLEGVAKTLAALGDRAGAVTVASSAAQIRRNIGSPMPPSELADFEAALRDCRSGLSATDLEKAESDGAALSTEDAVALALQFVLTHES